MNYSIISLSVEIIRRVFLIQDECILKKASAMQFLAKEKNGQISLSFSKKVYLSLLKEKLSEEECKKLLPSFPEQDIVIVDPGECEISPDVFN